ncbi:hypothetical protein LLEC1_00884 [Akanthomyces lecanii]|uniref:Uncharacterized protein n=1 Tax=Cordyceps confragosa TaxID=2714763 RepID=A0A179I2L7_CORDF|nr:hypothetical protein LLEC1_00884 [Akanthomyces lecanii]
MQDPRRPLRSGFATEPLRRGSQLPERSCGTQNQIGSQNLGPSREQTCFSDNRYPREYENLGFYTALSPGRGHRQPAFTGNASDALQMLNPAVCQHFYWSQDSRDHSADGYPHQPQYNTAALPDTELVASTVEKSYTAGHKFHSPAQDTPVWTCSPPPAYSRDASVGQEPSSRSWRTSSSTGQIEPELRPPSSIGRLADGYKLIAIPATSKKLGSPFLRAYPPALQRCGISRDSFLQFIDRLNRATVASPPVQVLGLAGNIVSFVPLHTAQIVGGAVNLAATVSTVAISKGRTEILLKEANSTLFRAAGLKVQVAKLDVVAKLGNIPILDAEGKVDKKSTILLPLEENQELHTANAQQRRVQALSAWLSALEVESLPELDESTSMMGKMHAKVSERQRQKEEKKMIKDRQKMQKDYVKDMTKEVREYELKMENYAAKESRIQEKGSRRMVKELRELEKKRDELNKEHDKEVRRIEKDRRKDDKEEESMRKILFLVIQKI